MFFTPALINRSAPIFFATPERYDFTPHAWTERTQSKAGTTQQDGLLVQSQEDAIRLSLDIPGLAREHLTIGIEGQHLRITAKDDAPRNFKANYKLRHEIDALNSEAKLEHGVLSLKLAKYVRQSKETLLTIQ